MPAMLALPSPSPRPWVAEDLDQMPEDGYRREIIDGVLIASPSPVGRHQSCVVGLVLRLAAAMPPEFKVMIAPYDWRPPGGDSLQPDVMVIHQADYDPDGPQRPTPALVVEVPSPSSLQYDTAVKRSAYERLGVPAYWIIDPATPSMTVLQLDRRRCYQEAGTAAGEECLTIHVPFPVSLAPAELVRGRRSSALARGPDGYPFSATASR